MYGRIIVRSLRSHHLNQPGVAGQDVKTFFFFFWTCVIQMLLQFILGTTTHLPNHPTLIRPGAANYSYLVTCT